MSVTTAKETHADEPAERQRRPRSQTIGALIGVAGFVILILLPTDLTGPQQRLTALLFLAVAFWMTEVLPLAVTSLLAIGLAVTMGIATGPDGENSADVVFSSFSSSVVFLLIGGFLFAQAIHVHGLDKRFALSVLNVPGVAKSSHRVIATFGAIALVISAFVSNSATTAMLLPIGLGLVTTLNPMMGASGDRADGKPAQTRFGLALMLMIAYSAAIGGLLTPVGSPASLAGLGAIEELTGQRIGFLEWTTVTAPIVAVMFVILSVVIVMLNRPETKVLPDIEYLRQQRRALGPMSRGEKSAVLAFAVVCVAWLTPGIVSLVAGSESAVSTAVSSHLDMGAVAVVAATLLFLLPGTAPGSKALTWEQAVRIDWGVIILIGAGLVLGSLLSSTGLAELTGSSISTKLGEPSLFVITLIAVAMAIAFSELTSNTVSVAVVVPIVVPIAAAAGVTPVIPAIAAAVGGSFGFMLPISQPPNAIVYGSGLIPIQRMVRTGVVLDVIGCVLVTTAVTIWVPILGIA